MLTNITSDKAIPGKKPFIHSIDQYRNLARMPTPIPPPVPRSNEFDYVRSRYLDWYHKGCAACLKK